MVNYQNWSESHIRNVRLLVGHTALCSYWFVVLWVYHTLSSGCRVTCFLWCACVYISMSHSHSLGLCMLLSDVHVVMLLSVSTGPGERNRYRYKLPGHRAQRCYIRLCLYRQYHNNNYNKKLQLGCHPVAVVILHVYKTWNWLLLNWSREGYMRSM